MVEKYIHVIILCIQQCTHHMIIFTASHQIGIQSNYNPLYSQCILPSHAHTTTNTTALSEPKEPFSQSSYYWTEQV